MKALVLTEGGRKAGFGHMSRCVSLTQGMHRFNKARVRFVVNGDETARNFLKRQHVKSIIISDWMKERDAVTDLVKSSDTIVIDSYLAPKAVYDLVYKLVKSSTSRLICIDDYNRIDYPPSVVLNPCIYGNELKYDMNPKSLYLLGKDYALLRKEFWRVPKKCIGKNVKDILLTFGGGAYRDFTERLIKFLCARYPKFRHHFITPDSNLSARDIIRLMLKCDICISSGGQTIYELARIGLPTIGICVVENQRLNLQAWEEKGFVRYIGWYNDDDIFNKLERMIEELLPYRERARCSRIGKNLIDGRGMALKGLPSIFKQEGQ